MLMYSYSIPDKRAAAGLHLSAQAGRVCAHGRHGVCHTGVFKCLKDAYIINIRKKKFVP